MREPDFRIKVYVHDISHDGIEFIGVTDIYTICDKDALDLLQESLNAAISDGCLNDLKRSAVYRVDVSFLTGKDLLSEHEEPYCTFSQDVEMEAMEAYVEQTNAMDFEPRGEISDVFF